MEEAHSLRNFCFLFSPQSFLPTVPNPGTFKFQKMDLRKEGYDPAVVKDRLYYLAPRQCQYLPLDGDVYKRIQTGQEKL